MDIRPRHFGRYRQIVQTLGRHGFGFMLAELTSRRHFPLRRQKWTEHAENGPAHLREALQELGATFIKLGQLLSTRSDILPPEYVEELALLQDSLPPLPLDQIAPVVQQELGAPPEQVFARFDPEALAAASTSQVHAAVLPDGREVVVKIQRPGVAQLFAIDLDIIHNLATLAAHRTRAGRDYDLIGLAEEAAITLRPSLNYRVEGRNAERFRSAFADHANVYIPEVHWEYTTSQVLTLERLHGVKITDRAGLDAIEVNRHELAKRSTNTLLHMVFEIGLFHADPHPGNFFVLDDGTLGIMDFGLVGHIGETMREDLTRLFIAVVNRDPERMVSALVELGVLRRSQQRSALVRDLDRLLFDYYDLPLGEIPVGQLLTDAMRVANRRGLQLPTSLALLATVVAANEGMGRALDPSFRLLEELRPYARHLLTQYYSPVQLTRRFGQGLVDAVDLAPQLPAQIQGVLRQAERGSLEVGIRSDQMEHLAHEVSASANRLALSAIVAAFIVSLAILLAVYRVPGPSLLVVLLFAGGFVIASALGLWLLISILRSD